MIKIDQIDLRILKLLQDDAELSNKEVAAVIGMSITPIYERIKRLKKTGVIKKSVALVDRKKVDKKLLVLVGVSLKQHVKSAIEDFMKKIQDIDEVLECFHVTGGYDFFLKIIVDDMDAYQNFIFNELSGIQTLGHAESYLVMKEVKNSTAIPLWKTSK